MKESIHVEKYVFPNYHRDTTKGSVFILLNITVLSGVFNIDSLFLWGMFPEGTLFLDYAWSRDVFFRELVDLSYFSSVCF